MRSPLLVVPSNQDGQERFILRVGAVMAMIGGLGYFLTLLVHGNLPDHAAPVAMSHIAGRADWSLLKLLLMAFVFCWIGAFLALAATLTGEASWFLSRMALLALTMGSVLVLVEYSILGYGLKNVSNAWAEASGPDQEVYLQIGRGMIAVTSGLFLSFISWLTGLPYVLMGLAVLKDGGYPRRLGWVAVIAGSGALFSGVTRFLGWEVTPFPVLYGVFVIPLCLWLATMGLIMWRRARSVGRQAQAGRAS